MKNNFIYTLFLISLFFSACDRQQNYNLIITDANNTLNTSSDSALNILQKIQNPENLKDSIKANYWLTLGQIHNNMSSSMADDSLLVYALEYYKTKNYLPKLSQAYRLTAHYRWWNNQKEDAYKLLNEGLNLSIKNNDTIAMVKMYLSLDNLSEKDNDLEKSLLYLKQLIKLDKGSPRYFQYYDDLGIIYFYLNKKDSSFTAFEKGLSLIPNPKESNSNYYIILKDYADILAASGESTKAIDLHQQVLKYHVETNSDTKSLSYLSLSISYLNIGKLDSAKYYMQMASNTKPDYLDSDLAVSNIYIVTQSLLNYAQNNTFNIKDLVFFSNTMFKNYIDKERVLQEKSRTKSNLEQNNLRLLLEKQHNQIIYLSICIALILIIGFFYLHTLKKKKDIIEKQEELETLKELLFESQKSENKQDSNFFKRILLQQLGIIRLAATSPTAQNQEFLQQMTRITNKDVPVDDLLVWDDLYKVIDSVYDNFYSNLISKYGSVLLEKEIQLCCLLVARFSTKEISVVSQQSVRTIYQRKTTIRQKLNMGEKEDIVGFLQG